MDLKIVLLTGQPVLTLTDADVLNPAFPGCRYRYLLFAGTSADPTRIVLPRPAGVQAYGYVVENRTSGLLFFESQDPDGGTFVFVLPAFAGNEAPISALVSQPASTFQYRSEVEVRNDGVFGVPGFTTMIA